MFLVSSVVASMQRNTMVVNHPTDMNLMVQPSIAFRGIQLIHESLSHAWNYTWQLHLYQQQTAAGVQPLRLPHTLLISPA
jgi:hypothetical protein